MKNGPKFFRIVQFVQMSMVNTMFVVVCAETLANFVGRETLFGFNTKRMSYEVEYSTSTNKSPFLCY